jgi:hypothetical protein
LTSCYQYILKRLYDLLRAAGLVKLPSMILPLKVNIRLQEFSPFSTPWEQEFFLLSKFLHNEQAVQASGSLYGTSEALSG